MFHCTECSSCKYEGSQKSENWKSHRKYPKTKKCDILPPKLTKLEVTVKNLRFEKKAA